MLAQALYTLKYYYSLQLFVFSLTWLQQNENLRRTDIPNYIHLYFAKRQHKQRIKIERMSTYNFI